MALSNERINRLNQLKPKSEFDKSHRVREMIGVITVRAAQGAGVIAAGMLLLGCGDRWVSQSAAKECAITGVSAFESEPELDTLCRQAYRQNNDGYADNDSDIEIYEVAAESGNDTLFDGVKVGAGAALVGAIGVRIRDGRRS